MTKARATEDDKRLGERLRELRQACGLSQSEIGDAMGVSFQQVQKIERGVNRISAVNLYKVANVLDVPIGYFFE